jgi:hypothetical protein
MEYADHNDVKFSVKRAHTNKVFKLCEEFNLLPEKTLNMALNVGLSKVDEDLRYKDGKRYLKKLSAGNIK